MKRFFVLTALFLTLALAHSTFGASFKKVNLERLTREFLTLCKTGSAQEITAALQAGANANMKDSDGITALMWCARYNTPEAVEVLLNVGANVNAMDRDRSTPLIWSTGNKADKTVLGVLLRAGANPNAKDRNGTTVLMHAAERMSSEAIWLLLGAGAFLEARNYFGKTVLMYAARYNSPQVIDALIEAGAEDKKDKNGYTALVYAAEYNSPEAVNVLLDAGADPYVGGSLALDRSRYNHNFDKTDTLLRLKALTTSNFLELCREGQAEYITRLLAAGANPNVKDSHSITALMQAAMYNTPEAVDALLESGADVNARDTGG